MIMKSGVCFPSSISDKHLVEQFKEFTANCVRTDHNIVPPYETSMCPSEFTRFEPLSYSEVLDLINSLTIKGCNLDPLPATIMKKCLPISATVSHNRDSESFSLNRLGT